MILQYLYFAVLIHLSISTRIQLSTGTIEGKILNATYSPFGNQTATVFLGIPYVEPPIGELRFRKPRLLKSWEGVLETKDYKPACMSYWRKTFKNGFVGEISEDCLYANVFTNQYCLQNKNCSVMIVVHGGRLVCESGSAFKPEIFINNFVGQDRNIVVVTFNYRLGVFGFGVFNGETGDTNVAMYDMLEAVKWVRKEIDQFGGNKDRITMAGHSAGAGLIVDFTSSTLSKGLLHQQIVMSAPLQDISKSANFKGMTIVAQNVGCIPKEYGFRKLSKTQINKTYLCLQNKSAQDLLHAQLSMQQNSTFYFGSPRVDGDFITDYPDNLFNFNTIYPINTFIGTTTGELRDSLYITDPKNDRIKEQLLKNMCEHVGYELFEKPEEFTKKCGNYYKNGTDAQFLSDDMEFYSGAIKVANAHKRANSKVFMYSYDYKGAGTAFHKYLEAPSPHHSEDLIYTFGTSRGPFVAKDYVIERIYSGMLANFINFEDPSPSKTQQWRQYTQEKREYFLIDFDKNFTMPGMKDHYYTRALDFWSTAGKKSFSERFSPSLDNFVMSILTDPIVSHLKGVASGPDKSIEQFEKVFNERESFLEELKLRRKLKLEKKIGVQMRNSVVEFEKDADQGTSGGVLNTLPIILGVTVFGSIIYASISHFCIPNKSRTGYQLLE